MPQDGAQLPQDVTQLPQDVTQLLLAGPPGPPTTNKYTFWCLGPLSWSSWSFDDKQIDFSGAWDLKNTILVEKVVWMVHSLPKGREWTIQTEI